MRKLDELYIFSGSGGTPITTNKAYYNGNINFLTISDISDDKFITKTAKTITEKGLQSSQAWVVPRGSIVLSIYASVGKVAILDINTATSQAFYNMIFDDQNLKEHIYYQLKNIEYKNGWKEHISTGTQGNLNSEKVKNLKIRVANNNKEIELINKFWTILDNIITFYKC
ncbi:restriction endonuclease subunit S [Mycoplasma sp. VS1572C]